LYSYRTAHASPRMRLSFSRRPDTAS
jgi:hypothetical protein